MVTKDVSRLLGQQRKHYVGARLEQGRVLLDSDFNESLELGREDQRRVLVDVIGPAGSPDRGFSIRRPLDTPTTESDRLQPGTVVTAVTLSEPSPAVGGQPIVRRVHPVAMRAGSLYTGGLRFDLEDNEALLHQLDYLQLHLAELPDLQPNQSARLMYFLRGWEQSVSALEDQELREAMLRGGDTSTRVRRMRRVEVLELTTPAVNCDEAWSALSDHLENNENGVLDEKSFELRSNARLQLKFVGGEAEDGCAPCDPFGLRYLGAENVTLRILLTSPTTFVWTLDDPRLFRVRVLGLDEDAPAEVRVELLDRPTEERDWPFVNRVVEIIPFGALLDGKPPPGPVDPHFGKVAAEVGVFTRALETFTPADGGFSVDQGDPATKPILQALKALIHEWPADHPFKDQLNVDDDGARHFYMRLWQQAPTRDAIELSTDPAPVLGTTGIQPTFFEPGHRGDYWIAALRPEAPEEIIPLDLLRDVGAAPSGPRRFFAPLAFVEFNGDTVVSAEDCRPRIRPLNNRLCTTIIVGDGIHSFGDYTTIQDAIRALPKAGGVISVRPGVYREPFEVLLRDNVIIEGCGPSTILQTTSATVSIAKLTLANHCQLRGFRIETAGMAIQVSESSGIVLADLDVLGGDFGGVSDAFRPGVGKSDLPLVSCGFVGPVTLRDVTLRTRRQGGISCGTVHDVTLNRVQALGSQEPPEGRDTEGAPMLAFVGTSGLVIQDCSLTVFTQVGIQISPGNFETKQLEFTRLDIDAGGALDDTNITTRVLAPFDLDDPAAVDVKLSSSRIRMRRRLAAAAAVSVVGSRITIENNLITADIDATFGPMAWGGIHVRGGSQAVTIRRNRIAGGAGHGVTLGSVRWVRDGSPDQRDGPGYPQLALSNTVQGAVSATGQVTDANFFLGQQYLNFTAVDEGQISDVVIADNRIETFSIAGVGALTVLGGLDQMLLEVTRLRIERNLIRDNARRPPLSMSVNANAFPFPTSREGAGALVIPYLPHAGIVLASGRNIEITDNTIVDNGQTDEATDVAVSGVFVLTGDSISIEGNRIANNGHRLSDQDPTLLAGVRAGIAVMLAGTANEIRDANALRNSLFESSANLDNKNAALRVANNTVIQPEGRALHAVVIGPVSVDGNFLSSQGNHGPPGRQDQFSIGDVVYLQDLGAPWESFELTRVVSGGTSTEYAIELTPHLSPVMFNKVLQSPRWYQGLGGEILFANNQVVYDWTIERLPSDQAPLSFFPNVILGLDHTAVIGNQFAVRLENVPQSLPPSHPGADVTAPLFSTVFAAGVTTNIELNRVSETLGSTFLSLLGNGDVLNITTLNETTHRIASTVTVRVLDKLIVNNNLILTQPPTGLTHQTLVDIVKLSMQDFLHLTFRPS